MEVNMEEIKNMEFSEYKDKEKGDREFDLFEYNMKISQELANLNLLTANQVSDITEISVADIERLKGNS